MGRLRLAGFLKLQVSFAKEPYKRDYILQTRPIIIRSLLIVDTPYKKKPTKRDLQKETYKKRPTKKADLLCVAMGWLRLGGSLKLQVSFAKEPY